jgi:methylase of polypeptide subunit release factors
MELGAGTGFLSMTLARNLPNAVVCATEMEYGGALEHLRFNVDENRYGLPWRPFCLKC